MLFFQSDNDQNHFSERPARTRWWLMIYDCFTFFNELELLELRLHELAVNRGGMAEKCIRLGAKIVWLGVNDAWLVHFQSRRAHFQPRLDDFRLRREHAQP